MNERLKERIQNFAEVVGPTGTVPPFPASDKGMQLMPDIRRDGLIPPRREGMQTMPDINRDGLEPDYSGAELMKQIEDLGGRVSEGERRLFMNMSPEQLKNMSFEDSVELSRKLNRVQPEPITFQQQLRNARMNDLMDALSQNKGSLSDREARFLIENFDSMDFTRGIVDDTKGAISDKEMELLIKGAISDKEMELLGRASPAIKSKGAISNREMELFERMSPSYDVDLMGLRQRLGLEPMNDATGTKFDEVTVTPEAEALSQMGRGKDTLLGHLEAGDVVVPPDVLENDPMLADVLEERMMMAGVDPASRVAGLGIASLNPNTGLEEFGLFKSIKKVVKKVAPYAGIIAAPFTGGLSAALIGAGGGLLSGKGLKGAALGALSGFGANAALGKLGLTASAVKGAGGLLPALKGAGTKIAGGLESLKSLGSLGGLQGAGGAMSGVQGGRGGLGLGSLLGAGIPAALLAKKAYDEAKADKGIQLTPMNQFDSLGRFNIEAEIARRSGKERPNPVEFGLLPELPELSGGKPIQQAAYGGPVMAFAEGGNVAMEDFQRMTRDINGAGTETSDDIPAMLSDGEFVMTARSVRGAGAFDMNNEGGIITLVPSMSEDRDRGTELMNQMMDMFSSQATPS